MSKTTLAVWLGACVAAAWLGAWLGRDEPVPHRERTHVQPPDRIVDGDRTGNIARRQTVSVARAKAVRRMLKLYGRVVALASGPSGATAEVALDAGRSLGVQAGETLAVTSRALAGIRLMGAIVAMENGGDVRGTVRDPQRRLTLHSAIEAAVYPEAPAHADLTVPASAVVSVNGRTLVYVESGGMMPVYASRWVTLGARRGNDVYILSGVAEGERVVAEPLFLLDADAALRSRVKGMGLKDDVPLGSTESEQAELFARAAAGRLGMTLVAAYLDAHRAIATRDLEGTQAAAQAMVAASLSLISQHDIWSASAKPIVAYSRELHAASSLDAARAAFADVSAAVIAALAMFGNPLTEPLQLAECEAAPARWVQRLTAFENPYSDEDRLRGCGVALRSIRPTERFTDWDAGR